jgi:hypothetical protein
MSKYHDIRQDFWREEFGKALAYGDYLEASPHEHRAKWQAMEPKTALPDEGRKVVETFTRKLNVLCLSGVWCGDCVRQGPMLQAIAGANDAIDLRFVEKEDGTRIAEELRINGAAKVPVVVFLSEDCFELGRFGDRLLTVYRRMARTQLGPACDTGRVAPPSDELAGEIGEWVDIFWRMQLIVRLSPMLRERYGD